MQQLRISSDSDPRVEAESTINKRYITTISEPIRHALDDTLELGDTVRWVISDGELSPEIVHDEYGAFEGAEPFDWSAWESNAAAESAWSE